MRRQSLPAVWLAAAALIPVAAAMAMPPWLDYPERSVAPCRDFYRFAAGGWLARHPPASSRSSRSITREMTVRNYEAVHEAYRGYAQAQEGSDERRIGDLYASCVDVERTERAGLSAELIDELRRIEALQSPRDFAALTARLQRGATFLFGFAPALETAPGDIVHGELSAGASSLLIPATVGRPQEDAPALQAAFRQYAAELFGLSGQSANAAARDARSAVDFEILLARDQQTVRSTADGPVVSKRMTLADVRRLAPHFDWGAYFSELGIREQSLDVWDERYFAALDRRLAKAPLTQLRAYLRWQLLRSYVRAMPSAFVEAEREFFIRKVVRREDEPRLPRAEECAAALTNIAGNVATYRAMEMERDGATSMVRDILASLKEEIPHWDWASPAARREMLEKADRMQLRIGYPSRFETLATLKTSSAKTYLDNLMALMKFLRQRELAKIGKPAAADDWQLPAVAPVGGYIASANALELTAGLLQPPFFDTNDLAYSYGAIGTVAASEMAKGVIAGFEDQAVRVGEQYRGVEVLDGLPVDAQRVGKEALARSIGIEVAYSALQRRSSGEQREPVAGFTPQQRFFLGHAQFHATSWGADAARSASAYNELGPAEMTGAHPYESALINVTLAHFASFAKTWPCYAAPSPLPHLSNANYWDPMGLAVVSRASEMTVIIAARTARSSTVAAAITGAEGSLIYRNDEVDYLRATIPGPFLQKLLVSPDIESLEVISSTAPAARMPEKVSPRPTTEQSTPAHAESPLTRKLPIATPEQARAYLPHDDMDIPAFRREHPHADGRDVIIAFIDGVPAFSHPELAYALDAQGRRIPKFRDIRMVAAPPLLIPMPAESGMSTWVHFPESVTALDGKFRYGELDYTAPHDGTFRVGRIGDTLLLADFTRKLLWADTRLQRDFRTERAMTDYALHRDIGILPLPGGPVEFVVQFDKGRPYVCFILAEDLSDAGDGTHGTNTATTIAGTSGAGGLFDGIAPGASLVYLAYFPFDVTANNLLETLIYAFENPSIDLIDLGAGPPMTEPRDVNALIIARLQQRYRKPLIVPAGNGGQTGDVVSAPALALSVGAYQAAASYHAVYGITPPERDNLHTVSSNGPALDGAMSPSLLAPSGWLSGGRGGAHAPAFNLIDGGKRVLPDGYMIYGGTSQATPTAAGAVALLISAAKQEGIAYDAQSINWALMDTARYLPNLPAHAQGTGLIQVAAAYRRLKELAKGESGYCLESSAPVRTGYSAQLDPPYTGRGLYEWEGWAPGDEGARTATIVRRCGSAEPLEFSAAWVGNDGTFQSQDRIVLPLDIPVRYEIKITPRAQGAHSAQLLLSRDGRVQQRMLTTIIAAVPLDRAQGYKGNASYDYPLFSRPNASTFFLVPPDTRRVDIRSSHSAPSEIMPGDASSMSSLRGSSLCQLDPVRWVTDARRQREWECTLFDPAPGVWQLSAFINPSRYRVVDEPAAARVTGNFTLTTHVRKSTPGHSPWRSLNLNRNEMRTIEMTVVPGAKWLSFEVDDPQRRLNVPMRLYYCTSTNGCARAEGNYKTAATAIGAARRTSSGIRIDYADPPPGEWRVLLNGAFLAAPVAVRYRSATH